MVRSSKIPYQPRKRSASEGDVPKIKIEKGMVAVDEPAVVVRDDIHNKEVESKKYFELKNFNLLSYLWAYHFKHEGDEIYLHSFSGSYDLTHTKKSFDTISLMVNFMTVVPLTQNVKDLKSYNQDKKNFFDSIVSKNINFQMFSPRQLVQTFALNVENNTVVPSMARSWHLEVTVDFKQKMTSEQKEIVREANRQIRNKMKIRAKKIVLQRIANYVGLTYDNSWLKKKLVNALWKTKKKIISLPYDDPIYKSYIGLAVKSISIHYEDDSEAEKTYLELPNNRNVFLQIEGNIQRRWQRQLENFYHTPYLFRSGNPLNVIPYTQSLDELDRVKQIMYYYKSKANKFNIVALKSKCAEEHYDELYKTLVKLFFLEFKDFSKEDIFPSSKSSAKDFLKEWKAEYKEGKEKLQNLGEENKMFKRIFEELRKQKFTDIMRLYLKRYNVPLTTILNYFE